MIISRTPLRISFFGGGTDLPAFTEKEFGCVISTSIDKFIYLTIHDSFDGFYKIVYNQLEHVKDIDEIKNTRVKEVFKKFNLTKGMELHSIADVPVGSGLGSSSSFAVGLLNLLNNYQNKPRSKKQLAEDASYIERNILGEPIGKQDQYAASFGGMNFIKFNCDGTVEIEKIKATEETIKKINERIILFYLNQTRSASGILIDQNANVSSDRKKFNALQEMKKITLQMKEELNNNKIEHFGKMLHLNWLLKKNLANGITNSTIDNIYERGIKSGAEGGKVLGAGGGGFIMFYCEPDKQNLLRQELKELNELKINFGTKGTEIIYPLH